jgi:hypothetical protein
MGQLCINLQGPRGRRGVRDLACRGWLVPCRACNMATFDDLVDVQGSEGCQTPVIG